MTEPAANWKAASILNCNAKQRFASQAEAEESIRFVMADRSRPKAPPLRAYQCKVCKGWHKTKSIEESW
jgi:hypothetical protein